MNWISKFSGLAIERLPKKLSPKGHAIADFLVAAGAVGAAIAFFKTGRKAAGIGALVAAAAETANPMVTDFPGGLFKLISFPTHGRVDIASASMVAGLPKLLGLPDGIESRFFYVHAATAMAITGLTDFGGEQTQRIVEGNA